MLTRIINYYYIAAHQACIINHMLDHLEKLGRDSRDAERRKIQVERLHCTSRGRQHRSPYFLLFPFHFDTSRPERSIILPSPRLPVAATLVPSPPLISPALQQPPLRQHHSPFTLFLSEILERGEGGRPSLFLPGFPTRLAATPLPSLVRTLDAAPAVFLPSSCSKRWVTSTSDFVFSRGGRNKKLRKKRKIDGWGSTWRSGEARDYFQGFVCSRSSQRRRSRGDERRRWGGGRYNTVFRYLAISAERDDTSECSLNLQYKTMMLFITSTSQISKIM